MTIKSRNKILLTYSMSGIADIIFLLLIFFMITSTLIAPNAIKVLLPKGTNQTMANAKTTVSITSDLNYYIETTPVLRDQLETELRKKLSISNDPVVTLHADKAVPYEHIFRVITIANRNKYTLLLASAPE